MLIGAAAARLPHGVLVHGGQAGEGRRRAAGRAHDALRQQEVAEQRGHEQVLNIGTQGTARRTQVYALHSLRKPRSHSPPSPGIGSSHMMLGGPAKLKIVVNKASDYDVACKLHDSTTVKSIVAYGCAAWRAAGIGNLALLVLIKDRQILSGSAFPAAAPHLPEQALEEAARQHVPGDGVGDGGEDPVELAQGSFSISLLAGDAVDELLGQPLRAQQAARAEPAQRHLRRP